MRSATPKSENPKQPPSTNPASDTRKRMQTSSERWRHVSTLIVALLVSAAAAAAIADYAGRVNAALLLVLSIAFVGWVGGMQAALVGASFQLLVYSSFIAEFRLSDGFVPERFIPQFLFFTSIAFAVGVIASKRDEQAWGASRGQAEAQAIKAFTRTLRQARTVDAIVEALRSAEFAALGNELRLFLGPPLTEIAPAPRDDAGVAAELAEIVWLTEQSPHRIGRAIAVLVGERDDKQGVLVSVNVGGRSSRRLSPPLLEAIGNLIALRLDEGAARSTAPHQAMPASAG